MKSMNEPLLSMNEQQPQQLYQCSSPAKMRISNTSTLANDNSGLSSPPSSIQKKQRQKEVDAVNAIVATAQITKYAATKEEEQRKKEAEEDDNVVETDSDEDDDEVHSRLPHSGITIFGKRWFAGIEDLLPCSFCSIFLHLLILITSFLVLLLLPSHSSLVSKNENDPDRPASSCTSDVYLQFLLLVSFHLFVSFMFILIDIVIIFYSWYHSIFINNSIITKWILLRIGCFIFLLLPLSIITAIFYFHSIRSKCISDNASFFIDHLSIAMIISSLIDVAVMFLYFLLAYGCGQMCQPLDVIGWRRKLMKYFCYSVQQEQQGMTEDVFESIAIIFSQFFSSSSSDSSFHVTPSDVLVALMLVKAKQYQRRQKGEKFYISASSKRWDQQYIVNWYEQMIIREKQKEEQQQQHHPEEQQHQIQSTYPSVSSTYSGENHVSMIEVPRITTESTDIKDDELLQAGPNMSEPHSKSNNATSSEEEEEAKEEEKSKEGKDDKEGEVEIYIQNSDPAKEEEVELDLAEIALGGTQPPLMPQDWKRISEAKHFFHFALGSYGWSLYTLNHPYWICTCELTDPCCRRGYDVHEMSGSGCLCPSSCCPLFRCCHASVNAFQNETRLDGKDILYCHLDRAPVYYLAVDKRKKALVIAIRGTMSIADCLIDMDARLVSLEEYGYPSGYTHAGMLRNALELRQHLDQKKVMESFLTENPDYSVVIVGHSLGAGTAALLTLILRSRFSDHPTDVTKPLRDMESSDTAADQQNRQGENEDTTYQRPPPAKKSPERISTAVSTTQHSSPSSTRYEAPYYDRSTSLAPRSLHCYVYGCPLLVDPITAQSPFVMSSITCFSYRDDLVARLSLSSLFKLRQEMIEEFEHNQERKWVVMRRALLSEWYKWSSEYKAKKAAARKSKMAKKKNTNPQSIQKNRVHRTHKSNAQTVATKSDHIQSPEVVVQATSDPMRPSSPPIDAASFHLHLRPSFTPGRIYHLLPVKRPKLNILRRIGKVFTLKKDSPLYNTVVYPVSHESYREIIINSHFFTDHMPYWKPWEGIVIPSEYAHPDDDVAEGVFR